MAKGKPGSKKEWVCVIIIPKHSSSHGKMNVEPASYIKSYHYQWLENKQLNDLCNEIFDNYKLYVRYTM